MSKLQFSANLGFLWSELALPDAILEAKAAGFDAVECHWPYDTAPQQVLKALEDTDLAMLSLNTLRGDINLGENGLSALPDRIAQARHAIDLAIGYAAATRTRQVHVMAGKAEGAEAHATFVGNLTYACDRAMSHGIGILIEPMNTFDIPGYFLSTTTQAKTIIEEVGRSNLKLMFDCYHVYRMEGAVENQLSSLLPIIGHIQFSSFPGRGRPDNGEINYREIFRLVKKLGYPFPLGAEYKPDIATSATLGWMQSLVSD